MALESLSADELSRVVGDWSSGDGPLYDRLRAALVGAIERSELREDTVLPTERALAARLAISRTTVVRAYGDLKRSGVLASRQGRGTWVSIDRPGPGTAEQRPPFTADLFGGLLDESGGVDMATSCPPMSSIVREVVEETSGVHLAGDLSGTGYLAGGLPALRDRFAAHLREQGVPADLDEVIVTAGAMQGIVLSAVALGAPGETVLVEEATFPAALDAFRAVGLRPQGVPMREGSIDVDALADRIDRVRPRLVYLTPVYQNPTGAALPPGRAEQVARIATETGVPIVEDRTMCFVELHGSPPPPPIASFAPDAPIVTLHSLSKVLWGGLRTGWARAPRRIAERLARAKLLMDMGSPVLAQSIALRVMPHLDRAIVERRALQQESYAALTDALDRYLPDWTYRPPSGGPVLLAHAPGHDTREVAELARRAGVLLLPGPALSADGDLSDHIRLPFVHPPDVVTDAIRRVAAAAAAPRVSAPRPAEVVV